MHYLLRFCLFLSLKFRMDALYKRLPWWRCVQTVDVPPTRPPSSQKLSLSIVVHFLLSFLCFECTYAHLQIYLFLFYKNEGYSMWLFWELPCSLVYLGEVPSQNLLCSSWWLKNVSRSIHQTRRSDDALQTNTPGHTSVAVVVDFMYELD